MSNDYEWLRRRLDQMTSRRAAMREDEEPDDDMLSAAERVARVIKVEQDRRKAEREDR